MMFCLNLVDNQEYKNYKQTKKIKDMQTLREIKNRKYYAIYEELCAGMVGIAKYTWFCPILQLARITLKETRENFIQNAGIWHFNVKIKVFRSAKEREAFRDEHNEVYTSL